MTAPLGSQQRPLRVAIIGAGPSAFYAADALLKNEDLRITTDLFDRLPTPFGLVRGGVAPDHQQIKSVAKMYDRTAGRPGFRFFGNVHVGRDLPVAELRERYDALILAVGNESDRKLSIPGEELGGVHSATEFVGWYNGHPDYRDHQFDLERAERVAIFGNGNVAVDVARVLAKDPDALASTDIADYALEGLRRSKVREILLIGRRGPAQAAFSPKEIKELSELDGVGVEVRGQDMDLDEVSSHWLTCGAPSNALKNVELLRACAATACDGHQRKIVCRFLASPVEFRGDGERLGSVRIELAELRADDQGTPRPHGTGRFEEIPIQLAFKAIGYRGIPIPEVPFDDRRGIIPNREGRILTAADSDEPLAGHYVVGWAKRGPTGLLGTNNADSKATVEKLLEDLGGKPAEPLAADHADEIVEHLRALGIDFVTYEDWQKVDRYEQEKGREAGRVRAKLTSVEELLATVERLRSVD